MDYWPNRYWRVFNFFSGDNRTRTGLGLKRRLFRDSSLAISRANEAYIRAQTVGGGLNAAFARNKLRTLLG